MRHQTHSKFLQNMSAALMDDSSFEDEEVARFVSFILEHLEMDSEEKVEWLQSSPGNIQGNPVLLAKLFDDWEEDFNELSTDDILHMIVSNAMEMPNQTDGFLRLFEDSIEQGLFDMGEDDCIRTLTLTVNECDILDNSNNNAIIRYFRVIGGYCKSKRNLGKYFDNYRLRFWNLEDPDNENGFEIIFETIKGEFFLDLKGGLDNFLRGFTEEGGARYADELETYLTNRGLNEDGEVVDSDADSQGNLAGFVDNDEEGDEDEDEDDDDVDDDDDRGQDRHPPKQKKRWIKQEHYDEEAEEGGSDDGTEDEDEEEEEREEDDEEEVVPLHNKKRRIKEEESDESDI